MNAKGKNVCQLVVDLHEAQLAANDGHSDSWELKKAILRERGFEIPDDLSPNRVPERMHRALERIISNALFLHRVNEAMARHPECNGDIVKLSDTALKDHAKRGEPLRPLITWRRALSLVIGHFRKPS